MPTLVAVGAEDRLTPPPMAAEIAGLIPGARLVRIPGCGHLPPLERPEETTALLRDWLRQLPSDAPAAAGAGAGAGAGEAGR